MSFEVGRGGEVVIGFQKQGHISASLLMLWGTNRSQR